MHGQKGVSLTGLILVLIAIALIATLGFKVVPAFIEYNTIKKIFQSMAEDPTLRSARRPELERAWAARATVDNIQSLDGSLIDYTKEADGWLISAEYSRKVPLFRNTALCIDFKPSSK